MGLFDRFRKKPNMSAASDGSRSKKPMLGDNCSDLTQYARGHIWSSGYDNRCVAEDFPLPSFNNEQDAAASKNQSEVLQQQFQTLDGQRKLDYHPMDAPLHETVNPNTVFDIRGTDSEHFWNHHGNTKEDYMELASHLPEVQERLEKGESLESIRKVPELKNTVGAYYEDSNMIKVAKFQDGYQFQDEGRHRMMAAKELGYDVPVKVIGEYIPEIEKSSTFMGGKYETIVTDKPVTLYRVYGGKSHPDGPFWSMDKPVDRMAVKMDSALLQKWGNSKTYVEKITVPAGTKMDVGLAAPQKSATGQDLPGGGSQVVLEKGYLAKHPELEREVEPLNYNTRYHMTICVL